MGVLVGPSVSAPGEGAEPRTAGAAAPADTAAGRPAASTADASRKYFKAVSRVLETFKPGPSLADSAAWLSRNARQVDQLPADNVDPELLVWGSDVSSQLREAAAVLSASAQRLKARTSSIYMPATYAARGNYLDSQQASQARADRANAQRQAQQVAAEERAASTLEAAKPLQAAMDARGKVRATMSERYGGGF